MELQQKFSNDELVKIIEEAMLYMCACPAQVAAEIRRLRELFLYQQKCETGPAGQPGNVAVHQAIARSAMQAHATMEACLEQILTLEGWDRQTLKMPEGLRRQRDHLIQGGK